MSELRRADTTGASALPRPVTARIFKDQSAADLRLHLFHGAVDAAHFDVLASGGIRGGGLSIRARIIGASHWLTITMDAETGRVPLAGATHEVLHEIFACEGAEPATGGRRLPTPMLPPPVRTARAVSVGLDYRFEARVVEGERAARDLSRLAARIRSARVDQIGLHCEFPARDRRAERQAAPCTLLLAGWVAGRQAAHRAELEVESAHSYPDEGRVVFSRSRVTTDRIVGAGAGDRCGDPSLRRGGRGC